VKFKLDENLSPTLAKYFESSGHEAHSVVPQSLGGQPDERVKAAVRRVVALLPTEKLTGTLWIVEDHRVRVRE
jgi:predicted nuclease of predicted toxin-antitoxin system